MYRTHTCGELTKKEVGKEVTLSGWVNSVRQHGGINFVNLRDRYGVTQLVFDKDLDGLSELKNEYVVKIVGKVRARPDNLVNKEMKTGEVEVTVKELKILNRCSVLPLDLSGKVESTDETRLKYRYLDLRRPEHMELILFRHEVVKAFREAMDKEGFVEIETPMLVKATPEGARDYIVPSRVNPGQVYALPQSPQLYKQILMVAGFDKYYQLARCLRDEDLRADRQPEHTQVDFEMSFVTSDDIRATFEKVVKHVFKKTMKKDIKDFKTISYDEAMTRYGTDKPDIRFGVELHDVTETVKKSDFNVFKETGHTVALVVDKELSRKEIDKLGEVAKTYKAKGLAWLKMAEGKLDGGVAKFLGEEVQKDLIETLKLKDGKTILFVSDRTRQAQSAMGQVRLAVRDLLGLVKKDDFVFAWVVDFPLFHFNEDEQKWEPEHHMFSMPKPEFVDDFEQRPEEVLGDLWDLTLNGWEMASGSIRVSNPDVQKRIMNFIGFDESEAERKFGFLLEAYRYGGPPHGGMGFGVERLIALMKGLDDIREVMAFPKNKNAQCPMDGCPSRADDSALKELHVKFVELEK
ncbi:TPA: aspartate--tRNA ligase [Candidatus Woesearchaeota archaeon]|nr:aspartate--tRNA ligase [Candidatus Woesearchaeota archaeon]